jgi:hypothetical protein
MQVDPACAACAGRQGCGAGRKAGLDVESTCPRRYGFDTVVSAGQSKRLKTRYPESWAMER